jgi:hypothetical protein
MARAVTRRSPGRRLVRGAALVAVVVGAAFSLGGCGATTGTAAPGSSAAPGAVLRSLDRLALHGARTTFEATYRVAYPTADGLRSTRVTVGKRGPDWRLVVGGTVEFGLPTGEVDSCRGGTCLAEGGRVLTPPVFTGASNALLGDVGLYDGTWFWSSTQGYPVTRADLARRGVVVRVRAGRIAGLAVSCVTMVARAVSRGLQTRVPTRTQQWCLDGEGLVARWQVGHHVVVLVSVTRHPPPGDFYPPTGAPTAVEKGPFGVIGRP